MTISEFVIGTLRPDVAQEGLAHIRANQSKIFNAVPGILSNHVAHVIKFNGKDVASEYKPILGLEWNDVADFHNFYPASEAFRAFVGVFGPYAAGKATPQLFEPVTGSSQFAELFSKGAVQILIAPNAGSKKEEVSAAWNKVLETVNKGALVGQWSGWGIEEAEGTWAGVLSWKGVDEIDPSGNEAAQKLKVVGELDEYVVSFASY